MLSNVEYSAILSTSGGEMCPSCIFGHAHTQTSRPRFFQYLTIHLIILITEQNGEVCATTFQPPTEISLVGEPFLLFDRLSALCPESIMAFFVPNFQENNYDQLQASISSGTFISFCFLAEQKCLPLFCFQITGSVVPFVYPLSSFQLGFSQRNLSLEGFRDEKQAIRIRKPQELRSLFNT